MSSRASQPVSSCKASYKKRPYTIRAPSTYGKKHTNRTPDAHKDQCLLECGTVLSDKMNQNLTKINMFEPHIILTNVTF
jgi:hypothetical protein